MTDFIEVFDFVINMIYTGCMLISVKLLIIYDSSLMEININDCWKTLGSIVLAGSEVVSISALVGNFIVAL